MQIQVNATVEAHLLGEFIDNALEGVDNPPAAEPSEIVKTRYLGEFVDEAIDVLPQQPPGPGAQK